jgi:hypothetical protein
VEEICLSFKYGYNALVYFGEHIATRVDRVARFGYDLEFLREGLRARGELSA